MTQQIPKRPAANSPEVTLEAARRMLSALGDSNPESLTDLDEALRSYRRAYSRLRELDDSGWDIDDQLVETMLDADQYIEEAILAETEQWVARHRIIPRLGKGEQARATMNGKPVDIEIVDIFARQAKYQVRYPESEHMNYSTQLLRKWMEFHRAFSPV